MGELCKGVCVKGLGTSELWAGDWAEAVFVGWPLIAKPTTPPDRLTEVWWGGDTGVRFVERGKDFLVEWWSTTISGRHTHMTSLA